MNSSRVIIDGQVQKMDLGLYTCWSQNRCSPTSDFLFHGEGTPGQGFQLYSKSDFVPHKCDLQPQRMNRNVLVMGDYRHCRCIMAPFVLPVQ